MEKIQSAIAKARADRAATRLHDDVPAVETPVPKPSYGPPVQHSTRVASRILTTYPDQAVAAALTVRWREFPIFEPVKAHMARNHVVTFTGAPDSVHFDVMRTRLLQLMRANGWRRVAITSPGPSCGKSTLALNLAFSFGRQPNLRTLLLELDLRRPSLARLLGLRKQHHFSRVLDGSEQLHDNAVRIGTNLAIATQSGAEPQSAEMLHSPAAGTTLDAIEASYDPAIMLCDLPPVFASDDAMAIMGHMDAALIVAGAEMTTIREIDRCEREVADQTNVIGVVLNKSRYQEKDFGYDYGG
ncbi:MAG: CpsD/CapB family tyrosine-protein kinase [Tabrizicola sp.]|jgi:Mrp family chromosome partitioning ATPase|nr:CpsD/CapB family tyrosine-protein kinase [Tabrizicola sp.]